MIIITSTFPIHASGLVLRFESIVSLFLAFFHSVRWAQVAKVAIIATTAAILLGIEVSARTAFTTRVQLKHSWPNRVKRVAQHDAGRGGGLHEPFRLAAFGKV